MDPPILKYNDYAKSLDGLGCKNTQEGKPRKG